MKLATREEYRERRDSGLPYWEVSYLPYSGTVLARSTGRQSGTGGELYTEEKEATERAVEIAASGEAESVEVRLRKGAPGQMSRLIFEWADGAGVIEPEDSGCAP